MLFSSPLDRCRGQTLVSRGKRTGSAVSRAFCSCQSFAGPIIFEIAAILVTQSAEWNKPVAPSPILGANLMDYWRRVQQLLVREIFLPGLSDGSAADW